VSSGNCGDSTSITNVRVIVVVTGVTVLTGIGNSGNLDEEPKVCDVLDSIKRDHFCRLGVASGGKGSLIAVLRERWVRVDIPPQLLIDFITKRNKQKEGNLGKSITKQL